MIYLEKLDNKRLFQERIERFAKEVEEQAKKVEESDDPEVVERLPDLLKVNFKPMDDIWRATGTFNKQYEKSGSVGQSFQLG